MIGRFIANKHDEQPFSRGERWLLALITFAGGVVSTWYHYDRPFAYDEVGTLLNIQKSIPYLLGHFGDWLTMPYFIVLEKAMARIGGQTHLSLILIPLLAGIAAIPLTAILARMVAAKETALVAALLTAINPLLIAYSGVLRAYSLFVAASLLALILAIRWFRERSLRNGIYLGAACLVLMLSHPNGAFVLGAFLLAGGVEFVTATAAERRSMAMTFVLPLVVAAGLSAIAYGWIIPSMAASRMLYSDTAPTSLDYMPHVFEEFFGSGFFGWPAAILLVTAIIVAVKNGRTSSIFLPYAMLQPVLMSAFGWSYDAMSFSRYLICLLPIGIVWIAEGIEWYAALLRGGTFVARAVIVLVLLGSSIPGLQFLLNLKDLYRWDRLSEYVKTQIHKGDTILYSSSLEGLNMLPYFSGTGAIQSVLAPYAGDTTGDPIQPLLQDQTVRQQKPRPDGSFFLITQSPTLLQTSYPSRTFGNLQVTVYPAGADGTPLAAIKDDMTRSVRVGEVAGYLADAYRNLWVLSKAQHADASTTAEYYKLYALCVQLQQADTPAPLLLTQAKMRARGEAVINP